MTEQVTKELVVRPNKQYPSLYEPCYVGGGELPDVLKDQRFTHPQLVQEVIDNYLMKSKKVTQEKSSGTAGNKSRAN